MVHLKLPIPACSFEVQNRKWNFHGKYKVFYGCVLAYFKKRYFEYLTKRNGQKMFFTFIQLA